MQGPCKVVPAHPPDLSGHDFALALSVSQPWNLSLPSRQENTRISWEKAFIPSLPIVMVFGPFVIVTFNIC